MASLNDLPYEIAVRLFEYLDLNTLLNCRLMNKKFKNIIEKQRITSLNVCHGEPSTYQFSDCILEGVHKFYLTNEPISECKFFRSKNLDLFKSNFMKTILCKIKRLCMDYAFVSKASGLSLLNTKNGVNNFENLEQLQIRKLEYRKNAFLKLPNLRILSINEINSSSNGKLFIDCSSLFALKIASTKIQYVYSFMRPESIIHLDLDIPDYSSDLFIFKNVEYITCDRDYPGANTILDYTQFKCLKELNFKNSHKENLKHILKAKKLKNCSYKIYYKGLCFETEEDLDNYYLDGQYRYNEEIDTKLICLNYDKTKSCMNYCENIDYTVLVTMLGSIPEIFFKKFNCILKLSVSSSANRIDQEQLIDFIKRIKDLRILDLEQSLDQYFYDKLNIYCPYLNRLNVKENKIINLDFLISLKYLKMFSINQNISPDIIKNTFDGLEKFCNFKCLFGNKLITICQGSYFRRNYAIIAFILYRLENRGTIRASFENLEALIKFLKIVIVCKQKQKKSNK